MPHAHNAPPNPGAPNEAQNARADWPTTDNVPGLPRCVLLKPGSRRILSNAFLETTKIAIGGSSGNSVPEPRD